MARYIKWRRTGLVMDKTHIALWAMGVAFFSLIVSACSFVLELRRWFDEGVKLSMNIMPDAKLFGGDVKDKHLRVCDCYEPRKRADDDYPHGPLQLPQ